MEIKVTRIATIAVASLLCVCTYNTLTAQTREEMKARAVQLQSRVDSLADALSLLRERYTSTPSERDTIAVQMQSIEPALYAAKRELSGYSQYLVDTDDNEGNATNRKATGKTLTAFIMKSVPKAQAASYRESIQAEKTAAGIVSDQMRRYEEANGIIQAYTAAETEDVALVLAEKFSELSAEISTADKVLQNVWAPTYDNKNYIYSLAMEKQEADRILATIDSETTKAELNSREGAGVYFSDAVYQYYCQKKAMLRCETAIASEFGLSATCDSLVKSAKALEAMNLTKPKALLPERSFIEYESPKVVRPLAYNSSNPIPQVKVYSRGTVFRILLGSYTQSPSITIFRYYTPLYKSKDIYPGKYTYYIGGFRTEAEAEEGVTTLMKAGFRRPRIVVWADGQYYDNMESWHNSDKYTVEIWGVDELPKQVTDIISENANLAISKAGSCYVVDSFQPSSAAEAMASRLRIASPQLDIRIVKKQ